MAPDARTVALWRCGTHGLLSEWRWFFSPIIAMSRAVEPYLPRVSTRLTVVDYVESCMAAWRLLANSVASYVVHHMLCIICALCCASYNTRKRRCNTRSQVPTGQVLCLSTCEYLLGHVFAASVAEHLRHRRCGDGVVRLDHCYRVLVEGAALPSIKRPCWDASDEQER